MRSSDSFASARLSEKPIPERSKLTAKRKNMKNEKEKFLSYEEVRDGGVTNMFDIENVIALSEVDLSKQDCLYIMKHYGELAKKYL